MFDVSLHRVRQSGRTDDAHVIKATDASAHPAANTPLVYVGSPKKNNTHVSVTFGMVAKWSRRVQQSVRTDVAWQHKSG